MWWEDKILNNNNSDTTVRFKEPWNLESTWTEYLDLTQFYCYFMFEKKENKNDWMMWLKKSFSLWQLQN